MDNKDTLHFDNIKLSIQDTAENEYEGTESPFSAIPYKFRFTFSNQDKDLKCLEDKQFIGRCKMIWKALINKMSENGYFYLNKYTSGFEVLSKGEPCRAHIHINFKSDQNKNSINRTIKRLLTKQFDEEYYGNSTYSFVPELTIKDEEKFFRYPLKQGLNLELCRGFSKDKLTQMHEVAKDSYAISCQVHQQKMDKKDNNDTMFLRALAKSKKNNDNSKRAISRTFVKHYREEQKPLNRSVIEGYVHLAMLELNIITEDELLDTWGL